MVVAGRVAREPFLIRRLVALIRKHFSLANIKRTANQSLDFIKITRKVQSYSDARQINDIIVYIF